MTDRPYQEGSPWSRRDLSISLSKELALLLSGACLIGILQQWDFFVSLILGLSVALMWWRTYHRNPSAQRAFVLAGGMVITGYLGIQVENWGIDNGYWTYHELTDGRSFPAWLPCAWMLAFVILYRLEEALLMYMKLRSWQGKFLLVTAISIIVPTLGEMVAINLGVWTYVWGSQIYGVPLLAIILLTIFHLAVFVLLSIVCQKMAIDDTVFGIPKRIA